MRGRTRGGSALLRAAFILLALLLALPAWPGRSTPPAAASPVGTWELEVRRSSPRSAERALGVLRFDADHTLRGYGIGSVTFAIAALSGSWAHDARGRVVGTWTQELGGETTSGSFVAKVRSGRSLAAVLVAQGSTFKAKGAPAAATPGLAGTWTFLLEQAASRIPAQLELSPSREQPGIVELAGWAHGSAGYFDVSGAGIVNSRGDTILFSESRSYRGLFVLSALQGRFDSKGLSGALRGHDDSGESLRVGVARAKDVVKK